MSYSLSTFQEQEDRANEKDPKKRAKYWLEDIKEETEEEEEYD